MDAQERMNKRIEASKHPVTGTNVVLLLIGIFVIGGLLKIVGG